VTCTGNPVLKDGESVMRGEVLAYDLADDRATLTAARGTIVPQPGMELAPRRKKEPAP
jgi:lipopolysaccharide export system protein LptA